MSKIEEMAKEYILSHVEDIDEVKKDPFRHAIATMSMQCYTDGANAVLEEIEKQIDSYDWDAYPITNFERLKNKIEQLKGGNK